MSGYSGFVLMLSKSSIETGISRLKSYKDRFTMIASLYGYDLEKIEELENESEKNIEELKKETFKEIDDAKKFFNEENNLLNLFFCKMKVNNLIKKFEKRIKKTKKEIKEFIKDNTNTVAKLE